MTLQQALAKLLNRRDKLTSEQCDAELAKIAGRLEEIDQRSLEIDYNAGGRPGPTLKAALETGTPQQVLDLQRECELLEAERASIEAQRDALRERREKAISEEAVPRCKEVLRKLPAAVSRVERLKAELREARAELDSATEAFGAARKVAADGGQQPPAMDRRLFDRLMDARGTNAEGRALVLTPWTGELLPHVAAARELDRKRWEREEGQRQAHAAREQARRARNEAS